jgi:DNA-binding winged helix-turn-helix (wHTH) protein/tetratricopeptide (TPR) repeat protein
MPRRFTVYRFGEFLIDTATREVRRGGESHPLPAKAFDCIAYLIEHRARAIGRDELIAAVWGRSDVSDSVLSQTVLHARRALDDTGRVQQAIRTVVGFGYHWVAPVEAVDTDTAPAQPPAVADDAAEAPPSLLRIRHAVLGAAALVLLAATWFAFDRHAALAPGPVRPATDALLVLPVEVPDDPSSTWMRLGVMDLVANRLRATGRPVVPSDHAVGLARAFDTDQEDELGRLARAAPAAVVLQPRAERRGARWHVSLRTVFGPEPGLIAGGDADDILDAGLAAADGMALQLGLPAVADARADADARPLRELLQQVSAATLSDHLDEARSLIERAEPAQQQNPEVRFRLAKIDAQAGRRDRAVSTLRNLLDAVTAERDPLLRARVLNALGGIATEGGDPAAAEPLHDEAIRLLQGSGNDGQLGKAFGDRAMARFAQRHDEAALKDFASARIALENAGDRLSLTFLDSNLGAFDMLRGRYREALQVFERAAVQFETLRIHYAALTAWDAVAQAQLILLDPAAALRVEPRLRELATRVTDPRSRISAGLTRVEILAANGMLRAAGTLLEELRAELAQVDDSTLRGRAAAIMARFLMSGDEAARAVHEAEDAFARLSKPDDSRQQLCNWLTLVRAQIASRQTDAASASVERMLTQAARDANPAARLYARLAKAETMAATGNARAANETFEQALADAARGHVPLDLLETASAYASWLIANRELAKAGAVVERIVPWVGQSYAASLLQLRLYHASGLLSAWRTALARTRSLAGERTIPVSLSSRPSDPS